jgi:uncharacterized protein (UPF0276 family)
MNKTTAFMPNLNSESGVHFSPSIQGAGLGLRRSLLSSLTGGDVVETAKNTIDFFEVAPENWIGIGGRLGRQLKEISERTPVIAHGLSLSVGGTAPLNIDLVKDIKHFLNDHKMPIYSEHLSYSADDGQLYDLLPLPFTEEAVKHVSSRIRQVQDILERRIAIENISYYLVPEQQMNEVEFVNAVLKEADCDLLLDVNNVYVNSQNHNYNPTEFINQLETDHVSYIHVAGHYREDDGVIIDTHGADVIDPVWALLDQAYGRFGKLPTLLERDFNLPALTELTNELNTIKNIQKNASLIETGSSTRGRHEQSAA